MEGLLTRHLKEDLLHRLHPLSKIALSFLLCVAVFASSSHLFILGIIGLCLYLAFAAGVGPHAVKTAKTLVLLSAFLFFVQILFVPQGKVYLQLPFGLTITDVGLSFSSLVVLRLVAGTLPLLVVLSMTPLEDICNALVEKCGIPYQYAFVILTTMRFIPVFSHDMKNIIAVQTVRGIPLDTKHPLKKIRLILPLCVPLLISSVKRLKSSSISAELRGFSLRSRQSGYKTYPFHPVDGLSLLGGLGILLMGILI